MVENQENQSESEMKNGGIEVALIKCPECGREVSDKAISCPNCGYPISQDPLEWAMDFENSSSAKAVEPKKERPIDETSIQTGSRNRKVAVKKKNLAPVFILCIIAAALVVICITGDTTSGSSYSSYPSSSSTSSYSSSSASHSSSSGSSSSKYSGSTKSSSSSKYSSNEIMAGVYTLAEKCVKNHLKSPSSAKFCSMSDCEFQKGEDGVYMMAGTVESENSYGAMLKETWGIMAKVDGDKVSLVMVQIGDQVYFD